VFRSTVKTFNAFPQVTAQVRRVSRDALDKASAAAAAAAQANSKHRLDIEVIPAGEDLEGYSAGIKSRRLTDVEGKTTPIALFLDEGTLGKRKRPLKRGRKSSWTQRNPGGSGTHTATRQDVSGKGIEGEHFFPKARSAGRKVLLTQIKEKLGPL